MASRQLKLEEIFLEAVQKDPADRQSFLEETCADGNVRTRVEALLKAHDSAGNFLEDAAVQLVSGARGQDSLEQGGDRSSTREILDFLDRCPAPGSLGQLAHYEIREVLGSGGMGVVLRGLDVKLNRVVAIKVLAPQLAANATARQRFLREAQAAAAVSHDHVVAIHAVDEFKGLPYLVMEYIAGSSLQQKIDASGSLALAQILRISMQIASGLAAAHAQGLVHRDIKPANMLLENGIERVKITDFGLARSVDDVRITQAGMVYGTPLYMSPEQAHGERIDQRSDLFSLGSVMYAMCTGRPPFRGETGLAVLKRVCDDMPRPIREVNPDIPEALAATIDKLLGKQPDARFQNASEVADLLGQYLSELQRHGRVDSPSAIPPPQATAAQRPESDQRPLRGRRWPLAIAASVVLIAGFGLTEATGFTKVSGTVIRLFSPDGTLDGKEPLGTRAQNGTNPGTTHAPGATNRPVKVFILAGDSNMAGRAAVALLKYQANQPATKKLFRHLVQEGQCVVREDVWIKSFRRVGNLTAGFGQEPDRFGPELEFGTVVGDYFDEQVLLIKTCWGGHDIYRDFRPPSSGLPPQEVIEQRRVELLKEKPEITLADVEQSYGATYREMLKEIQETLASLDKLFPAYQGQGYEIAGFVWFSGWNDMLQFSPAYVEHQAHFIRDARRDLKAPKLPFVIGQLGVEPDAVVPGANDANFRVAQAEVARLPEFQGNVKLVETDPFWDREAGAALSAVLKEETLQNKDEWNKVGSDLGFHYLGSAKTFCAMGKAFGEGMLELHRSAAKN